MNGRMAKKIRKVLQYEKSPNHIVERGGVREVDGELRQFFIRNPEANRYRWWKFGYRAGKLPLELVDHLAHQQELRRNTVQDSQHSGEENE